MAINYGRFKGGFMKPSPNGPHPTTKFECIIDLINTLTAGPLHLSLKVYSERKTNPLTICVYAPLVFTELFYDPFINKPTDNG